MENSTLYQKGLTSIIVPIRFRPDLTKVCLDSIINYTQNYELIIVCDGIKREEFTFLKDYNTTILYNEKALGFVASVNKGFKIAKGEFVMELNSDTVVTPGWIEPMLEALNNNNIGLVAPTLPEEGPQSIEQNKNEGEYSEVSMVKGVCFMLKHTFMDEIGY